MFQIIQDMDEIDLFDKKNNQKSTTVKIIHCNGKRLSGELKVTLMLVLYVVDQMCW